MADRPILFSGPMVRALLEGRKTQTRRVLLPPDHIEGPSAIYDAFHGWQWLNAAEDFNEPIDLRFRPGDRLWVKETWRPLPGFSNWDMRIRYAVDDAELLLEDGDVDTGDWNWPKAAKIGNVSSLFMPRWASRLTLAVTDVRVQRVQDISHEDAAAEGCRGVGKYPGDFEVTPRDQFRDLWNRLNEKRGFGWDANPWVVALTFTVEHRNIDLMKDAA